MILLNENEAIELQDLNELPYVPPEPVAIVEPAENPDPGFIPVPDDFTGMQITNLASRPVNDNSNVEVKKQNKFIGILAAVALLFALKDDEKRVGQFKKEDLILIAMAGGLFISFDLLKKTFEGLGIWKDKDAKDLDNVLVNPLSFWSPTYYQQFSFYTFAIDTNQARALVKRIKDSFGIFNDCEACVKAVFAELKTKSNVSFLAKVFQDETGQNLLSYLRGGLWPQDRLSDKELNEINFFLSKLPDY